MHINQEILKVVGKKLPSEDYSIYIDQADWKEFSNPIPVEEGNICRSAFEKRQTTAIKIMREILSKHGKQEVISFLGQLADMEPKIQELKPYVRDHVVHAFNTFLLGMYFIEKLKLPKTSKFDRHPFVWKLSGLTHDLGYPLEISSANISAPFMRKINEIIRDNQVPSEEIATDIYPLGLDKLCPRANVKGSAATERAAQDLIQKRISDWELDVDVKKYCDWLKKNNRVDHGLIGALAQLKVLDILYYSRNPKGTKKRSIINGLDYDQRIFDSGIVSASTAIFLHNIDRKYLGFKKKINFKLAPIAFLLFLCDTIQEWDRYAEHRDVYSGNDFGLECAENSISIQVPRALDKKICDTLSARLTGLSIRINDKQVVV